MKVRLNNRELHLDSHQNLVEVMKAQQLYHDSGIAVAINEEIVPKSDWNDYLLQNNDNILIITATQGG